MPSNRRLAQSSLIPQPVGIFHAQMLQGPRCRGCRGPGRSQHTGIDEMIDEPFHAGHPTALFPGRHRSGNRDPQFGEHRLLEGLGAKPALSISLQKKPVTRL